MFQQPNLCEAMCEKLYYNFLTGLYTVAQGRMQSTVRKQLRPFMHNNNLLNIFRYLKIPNIIRYDNEFVSKSIR